MKTQPSPAPWQLNKAVAADGTVITCPDGVAMRLIVFYGKSPCGDVYSDGITVAQYEANIRCMAASADLLKSLKNACAQYEGFPPSVLDEIAPDWLYDARQAISKAIGQP